MAADSAVATAGRSLEMEQRLERTLSGMIKDERAAAAPTAAKKASTKIDDMLSATLSGLDMPKKTAKPPAPSPPSPAAPPTPPTPPAAAAPARPAAERPPASIGAASLRGRTCAAATGGVGGTRQRGACRRSATAAAIPVVTAPAPAAIPAARPPAAPAGPPAATAKPPEPTTAARKQSREIDLAQLDQLAKPRAKESAPAARPAAPKESFATQKISVQPSFLQPPSSEFGQYTLLERIAVGGMAEVWKARMKGVEGFQKTVAIKKILPHLTDSSDFVTMFIDEAKLAAQLNHNNIIHIYDLGKIGDDYFIAMEFVDGKDLRSILNSARAESRPLPLGLALLVGSRLASALDHAHRQKDFEGRALGLVHRDVSPQNVLISYDGDIKLCDFGIVKAVTKASKTQMGALKGKLQYMSPEQAWGRPVDARSDIFSLGSLLFEMLTGRRLFSGESEMSVLDAVREGRIQAPRDLDPRLPLEVNALVLKALARDPDDRFQTAGEMQREIDGILASLKPAPSQADLGTYLHQLFAAEARAGAAPAAATATPVRSPRAARQAPPRRRCPRVHAEVRRRRADRRLEDRGPGRRTQRQDALDRDRRGRGGRASSPTSCSGAARPPPRWRRRHRPRPKPLPHPKPAAATGTVAADGAGCRRPGSTAAPAATAPAAGQNVDQMVSDEVKRREEELKKKYEDELARRKTELDKLNTKPHAAPRRRRGRAAERPPPAQEAPPEPTVAPAVEPPPVRRHRARAGRRGAARARPRRRRKRRRSRRAISFVPAPA